MTKNIVIRAIKPYRSALSALLPLSPCPTSTILAGARQLTWPVDAR